MGKDLTISMLLDFYKQLLTDKQTDALDLYYNQDLSLSEIAEHLGITRQGVRDNIKRGEKQLWEYENELGLAKKYGVIVEKCNAIYAGLNSLKSMGLSKSAQDCIGSIEQSVGQIENIL